MDRVPERRGWPPLEPSAGAAVTAQRVDKEFGGVAVISGLTLAVPPGSIVGLIGPSGCGKTTVIRLMTGTLEPTAGSLRLLGKEPTKLTRSDRRQIGYLPQLPVLFPELSVWHNLNFHASLYGVRARRRKRLREMLDFVDLREDRRKRVNQLSGGMQRRVALASALVHDPKLIFLDEPTAGIDPILRQRFWDHFRELRDDGRTLVVSTQYVGEAANCDLVAVLANGRLVMMDTPENLHRGAYGGEIVDVTMTDPPPPALVDALARFPGVTGPVHRPDAFTVRLVVDRAAEFIPQCLRWLEQYDVKTTGCQEHAPDFDDVFVRLVEADASNRDPAELAVT
jgi:ABC-2 type transport system ATP-binding protein